MASTSPFVTWLTSLSSAGSVTAGSDLLYISQGSASKKITPNSLIFGRANTFSAQNTFAAGTVTTSQPFSITQTWDAAVTFTGFSIDITNTSSNANSILASFGVGGVGQFRIMRNSQVLCGQSGSFWNFAVASITGSASLTGNCVAMGPSTVFGWNSGDAASFSPDAALWRDSGGIVGVRGGSLTTPGGLSFYTYGASPPAAPADSTGVLYTDTSGGKIRLMVRFPTGAAQQIAIEP